MRLYESRDGCGSHTCGLVFVWSAPSFSYLTSSHPQDVRVVPPEKGDTAIVLRSEQWLGKHAVVKSIDFGGQDAVVMIGEEDIQMFAVSDLGKCH